MILGSNEQLQQEFEYTRLKPDYHSWWISKMQSGREEERYAIKFCFKLGRNATETYGILQTAFRLSCMNRASVFEWHERFKERRESVSDDERYGRSKEVNTPELISQIIWNGTVFTFYCEFVSDRNKWNHITVSKKWVQAFLKHNLLNMFRNHIFNIYA